MTDIKRLIETKIGEVTDAEIIGAIEPTWRKLQYIISREGSDGGARFTYNYFASLCAENIIETRFTQRCRKSTKVVQPEPMQTVIMHIIKVTNK